MDWAKIIDCGDIPVSPFDNALALRQMSEGLDELGSHGSSESNPSPPKLLIMGGDHSVALPALRALARIHGQPISVVHFDAHMDTLHPHSYPSQWSSDQTEFTHGSMFWQAYSEGLVKSNSSVHVGLRTRLTGTDWSDYQNDDEQGYYRLMTNDIDEIGSQGIIDAIVGRIGHSSPVYLSIDIDVLDPSTAPGTGAPESGGWTFRELNRVLRGLENLNIVGADIVEVAPAYDDRGETTAYAAAQLVYEILTNWVVRGKETVERNRKKQDRLEL
jgi:agmatinase